jgi:hypothetical protein
VGPVMKQFFPAGKGRDDKHSTKDILRVEIVFIPMFFHPNTEPNKGHSVPEISLVESPSACP